MLFVETVEQLKAIIVEKDKRIGELEAIIVEKDKRIAELEARVSELEAKLELLMRTLNRNSRNSSKPPSTDIPGNNSKPHGPARKKGARKGHKGAHRVLLDIENPKVENVFPSHCEHCATVFDEPTSENDYSRQQTVEMPDIKPDVTEYRRHTITCQRCKKTTRARMDGVAVPASPFGPRLHALVGMLTGVYHLSRRKVRTILHDMFGLKMSIGAISSIEKRVYKSIQGNVLDIEKHVLASDVAYVDATSWLDSGNLKSLWVMATEDASMYRILDNGSADSVSPWLKPYCGIVVSDRATVYSFLDMSRRQICWAHLLRKFVETSERKGDGGKYGKMLLDYTELMFNHWHNFKEKSIERDILIQRMDPLKEQFEALLQTITDAGIKEVSGSCADILHHKEALWTFVKTDGVEPTNNHAEQELRLFVIWRKLCFGAQSAVGHLFAAGMMTIARTARKQESKQQQRTLFEFIIDCCNALFNKTQAPLLLSSS